MVTVASTHTPSDVAEKLNMMSSPSGVQLPVEKLAPSASPRADKYRGATVEDLDPPPALSLHPHDTLAHALLLAFEHDYTHLTVVAASNRALLGYVRIPELRRRMMLESDNVNGTPNAAGGAAHHRATTDKQEQEQEQEQERQRQKEKQPYLLETDTVEKAMLRFRRKGRVYKIITMETPLEELEEFFRGGRNGTAEPPEPQDFAVVTDPERRFVLGVVTKADLEEFVRRRPLLP